NERKRRNGEYYMMRKKNDFWDDIANKINIRFGTNYNGKQCSEQFRQLVRDFN
ncbi:13379_t:CDS:1, partial [Racocetra persica]